MQIGNLWIKPQLACCFFFFSREGTLKLHALCLQCSAWFLIRIAIRKGCESTGRTKPSQTDGVFNCTKPEKIVPLPWQGGESGGGLFWRGKHGGSDVFCFTGHLLVWGSQEWGRNTEWEKEKKIRASGAQQSLASMDRSPHPPTDRWKCCCLPITCAGNDFFPTKIFCQASVQSPHSLNQHLRNPSVS